MPKATANKPFELPKMMLIKQLYDVPPSIEPGPALEEALAGLEGKVEIKPGMKIAVGVGSRGIDRLAEVVKGVIAKLRAWGAEPFVIPAMGSHGGAVAEGQIDVLRHRGVTEETVGCPVKATMEVVSMGDSSLGFPLNLDRLAAEADGIVLINRAKPHTNFVGPTESGILKMMAIGLGNQQGAEFYHRYSLVKDQYTIISTAGRELIAKNNFLFGVCLVENQDHKLCKLAAAPKADIEAIETEMCTLGRNLMPKLPMDQIDLLIIDLIGKDISGEGADPNVIGRDCCAYGAKRPVPAISRILILDLTPATEGAALGVGQADFTVQRLVDKIDYQATAVNCLTACCPEAGMVPLTLPDDKQALAAALPTLRPYTLGDLGVVHIKSTIHLRRMLVSEAYREQMEADPTVEIEADGLEISFDQAGNLVSPLRDVEA